MSTAVSIIIGIVIFSIIIIFHEFGHFTLAKKNGIGVPEFSLGLGPTLCGFEKGGTKFSLKLFPIGGACQMVGEDEESEEANAFNNKSIPARFSVLFAGPFFNFILAFVCSVILIACVGYDKPYVLGVNSESAVSAGLQTGDIIKKYNGKRIQMGRELYLDTYYENLPADPIELLVDRDGEELTIVFDPLFDSAYYVGFSYYADSSRCHVASLSRGGAFEAAGLKQDDVITSVNGFPIATGEEYQEYSDAHPLDGSPITFTILRGDNEFEVVITPKHEEGYELGFSFNTSYRERVGLFETIGTSFKEVIYWIRSTVKSLVMLVTGQLSATDLGGPVRIVSELGNTVERSAPDGIKYVIMNLLNWVIMISANVGVMNLLPIPALDGGRILFLIFEAIIRKPLDRKKEGIVNLVGFALLMCLMVFIFYNDIKNIFF